MSWHSEEKEKESWKPTVAAHALFQLFDFRQGRVLSACSQKVAKGLQGNATVAAFIEQGKSLLVVGRSL